MLPVHFLTKAESGREEQMMRDWMDVLVTESGLRQVPYFAAVSLSLQCTVCICHMVSWPFTKRLSTWKRLKTKPTSQVCWSPNSPSAGRPCWSHRWPRSGWTTIARSPSPPIQRSQGPGDRIIAWLIGNPNPYPFDTSLNMNWAAHQFLSFKNFPIIGQSGQHQSQTTIIQTFSATLSQVRRVTSDF